MLPVYILTVGAEYGRPTLDQSSENAIPFGQLTNNDVLRATAGLRRRLVQRWLGKCRVKRRPQASNLFPILQSPPLPTRLTNSKARTSLPR